MRPGGRHFLSLGDQHLWASSRSTRYKPVSVHLSMGSVT